MRRHPGDFFYPLGSFPQGSCTLFSLGAEWRAQTHPQWGHWRTGRLFCSSAQAHHQWGRRGTGHSLCASAQSQRPDVFRGLCSPRASSAVACGRLLYPRHPGRLHSAHALGVGEGSGRRHATAPLFSAGRIQRFGRRIAAPGRLFVIYFKAHRNCNKFMKVLLTCLTA